MMLGGSVLLLGMGLDDGLDRPTLLVKLKTMSDW